MAGPMEKAPPDAPKEAADLRPLGRIGTVEVLVAEGDQPWLLPIDALVISVGDGLGGLGTAMRRRVKDPCWGAIKYASITPQTPQLLELEPSSARSSSVRAIIAATPHPVRNERPTTRSVAEATVEAVRLAARSELSRLGMPLLGAGALGGSTTQMADVVVRAATELLRSSTGLPLRQLVLVSLDRATTQAIVSAWDHAAVTTAPPPRPEPAAAARATSSTGGTRLRPGATELLRVATLLNGRRGGTGVIATDVVLAALVRERLTKLNRTELAAGATHELKSVLPSPADRQVDAALAAHHIDPGTIVDAALPTDVTALLDGDLVGAARTVAARVGAPEVLSHHLVAAALDTPLPDQVLAALAATQDELRQALRRGVERRWPTEDGAVWDDLLVGQLGRYGEQAISTDYWTTEDALGYDVFANAIAFGIQHPMTRGPLTIGIKAPWGAGKTSLMRMVRHRLEWPEEHSRPAVTTTMPRIGLSQDSKHRVRTATAATPDGRAAARAAHVTNRTVLTTSARKHNGGTLTAVPPAAGPWRPTVWFNPWMYQTGEQVWAGLAHEIISQVTGRMKPLERELFWLYLRRSRIDEQAVRHKIHQLVLERMVPVLITGVLVLVAGVIALALQGPQLLTGTLLAGGPVGVSLAALLTRRQVLSAPASAVFRPLVSAAGEVSDLAADQLRAGQRDLIESPEYRSRTGSFYLMHTDIERVVDLVATPERPLVIFVDDLDRCTPSTVVQVIEAVNLFLAGQLTNCIFVLAMDPEVVAAHIETAYQGVVDRMARGTGRADPADELGWRFLEKVIQLPLTLPVMEVARRDAFYASFFDSGPTGTDTGQPETPEQPPNEEAIRAAQEQLADVPLTQVASAASEIAPGAVGREAARRAVRDSLTAQTPEVKAALAVGMRHLDANPREIKRFVNLFRFLVMINHERGDQGLNRAGALGCLAKIAVINLRWPGLIGRLADHGPDVLAAVITRLERSTAESTGAAESSAVTEALVAAGLSPALVTRLQQNEEFLALLRARPLIGGTLAGLV